MQKLPFRAKCNFVLNVGVLLLGEPAGIEAAGKEVLNGSEVVLDAWVVDHHQLE